MTPEQRALLEQMEERFAYAAQAHAIRAALSELDALRSQVEELRKERDALDAQVRGEWSRAQLFETLANGETDRAEAAEKERDALRAEAEKYLANIEERQKELSKLVDRCLLAESEAKRFHKAFADETLQRSAAPNRATAAESQARALREALEKYRHCYHAVYGCNCTGAARAALEVKHE